MKPYRDCIICQGASADAELLRIQIWEDQYWRLSMSLAAETLGFSYLEPKRHITDITQLDGDEARTLGETLARVTQVLCEEIGADLVYIYVFGDSIPHLHFHLAPHRPGDALNTQMVRGEMVVEKLDSGLELHVSKDFPLLPEEEQRQMAEKVRRRLSTSA